MARPPEVLSYDPKRPASFPDSGRTLTDDDVDGKNERSLIESKLGSAHETESIPLTKLKLRSTILDGELVALDFDGIPRFQLLQRFQKQPVAPTLYYVFDVLWHQGVDLMEKPILDRRKVLERILKPVPGVQIGSYVEAEGKALFELAKERGMEGIIAKRKDSL